MHGYDKTNDCTSQTSKLSNHMLQLSENIQTNFLRQIFRQLLQSETRSLILDTLYVSLMPY